MDLAALQVFSGGSGGAQLFKSCAEAVPDAAGGEYFGAEAGRMDRAAAFCPGDAGGQLTEAGICCASMRSGC